MEFEYIVVVKAATPEHADRVMSERLGPDEDYGFEYTIEWHEREDDD